MEIDTEKIESNRSSVFRGSNSIFSNRNGLNQETPYGSNNRYEGLNNSYDKPPSYQIPSYPFHSQNTGPHYRTTRIPNSLQQATNTINQTPHNGYQPYRLEPDVEMRQEEYQPIPKNSTIQQQDKNGYMFKSSPQPDKNPPNAFNNIENAERMIPPRNHTPDGFHLACQQDPSISSDTNTNIFGSINSEKNQ